jgi:hypothetical protein
MTPEEMNARTQGKIEQVKAMMKALNLTMSAEEVIDDNNTIRKVVVFYDNEIYPKKDETKDTPIQQPEA